MTTCALCLKEKKLQKSHIIPRASYKKSMPKGQGVLITANPNEKIRPTQDQRTDFLLCSDCEQFFSKNYEKHSIEALNGRRGTKSPNSFMEIDLAQFELFFLSILWRAAVSKTTSYNEITLNPEMQEQLRSALLEGFKPKSLRITTKLQKIVDDVGIGFDESHIAGFQIKPLKRTFKNRETFNFLLEGYFVEFFVPGLNHSERQKAGIINPSKSALRIDNIDLQDIPELLKLIHTALEKDEAGATLLKK